MAASLQRRSEPVNAGSGTVTLRTRPGSVPNSGSMTRSGSATKSGRSRRDFSPARR